MVLALFDSGVDNELKTAIATALQATPKPAAYAPAKPTFPTRILEAEGSTLASFIGPNSWLAFSLFGIDDGWLQLPAAQWGDDGHYQEMSAVMMDLAVINDTAERGVEDIQDYANAANDGDHRGNIILVSASHRIRIPAFLKNEMEENM